MERIIVSSGGTFFFNFVCIIVFFVKPSTSSQWPFNYSSINVWPMPTNVTLPSAPLGPHIVDVKAATIHPSCGKEIEALAAEALQFATTFLAPVQTYAEAPYATRRNAECNIHNRCEKDTDCSKNNKCYVKSNIRWNSSTACSPSSSFNAPCGCCTTPSLPKITEFMVSCNMSKEIKSQKKRFVETETYEIVITDTSILIHSYEPHGAANGLSTLSQLLRYDSILESHVMDIVPLQIFDEPLYQWRGFMVDTSRHFIPINDILNLIDAISAAKLNTFHWHIVDSPSFPYQSKMYPELSKEGSWGNSLKTIYTTEDVQAVIAHGKKRFVQVMMEIDTPAHTLAIAKAHPEMVPDGCWHWMADSQFKIDVDSDDCMALDPTNNNARTMVANLLNEVAEVVGENNTYVHIGGDEVKFDCWRASATINDTVNERYGNTSDASFSRLQAEWTANVTADAVVKANKKVVLWQPTTKGPGDPAWDGVLPDDAVYMVWLNEASAAAYANAGSDVIVTTPYYIAGMGTSGWLDVYNADVLPANVNPDMTQHILGAEICSWGESLGAGNFAQRSFQIGMAGAESFWRNHEKGSGPGSPHGVGLSDRYNRFLCHLTRYGIKIPPIMPSYCNVVNGSPA